MLPPFRKPVLTRRRIWLAFAVALLTDGLQMLFLHVGWLGPDQALDVIAMVFAIWLLGFHPLLLPTFVLEFIPTVGMIPTWTGCVAAVVALRLRHSAESPKPPVIPPPAISPSPPSSKPSPPAPTPPADVIEI